MLGRNKLAVIPSQTTKPTRLFAAKDLADRLAPHFFFENSICNFAISGQGNKEHLISPVLKAAMGRLPVIILHNENHGMMAEIARVWTEKYGSVENAPAGPLWSCSTGEFEPFLGLDEMDIVQILKKLAEGMGYSCTANFEKVVGAHLSILRHMNCDYSLSGLYYLCGFEDLEAFQRNIIALSCSLNEKNRIIANLGLANEKDKEQFDQFRSMIFRMGYEAKRSGWNAEDGVGSMSVSSAIHSHATMTLSVSASKSPLLMAYLGQELHLHNDQPCLLIIDDVLLENSDIVSALRESGFHFRFCILGSNILEVIGGDRTDAHKFCEQLDLLILLRHNMSTTADALSELLGKVEIRKEAEAFGTGRNFFSILPRTEQKTVTYTTEEQRRVKTEQIMTLDSNSAIVFHADSNEILFL